MVNSEDFSKRLREIFDYYELTASSFADRIDVGRASISHILSGRNKPSLDFVMKVVSSFDEVELYWLLNGKGQFPSSAKNKQTPIDNKTDDFDTASANSASKEELTDEVVNHQSVTTSKKKINKVIIFYSDGSFESYENYP